MIPLPDSPPELALALADYLSGELSQTVSVENLKRLTGGASRETWAFDASWAGKSVPLILRRDPPGAPASSDRLVEMAVIREAGRHGVPVPTVLCGQAGKRSLGTGFFIMERLDGETVPRKILRNERFSLARERLISQCASALGSIHQIAPASLPELGMVKTAAELVAGLRDLLDALYEPHPVFELALAWLEDNLPEPAPACVVHGDFRTGNFLVNEAGLRAVLDWELAHFGDPMEDLGWLCVRSWRFGNDHLPAGGLGTKEQLFAAYERAGGKVDVERVRFYEVYGTLKWGIICVAQAATHLRGLVRSVELAAIGRRACETEYDLLMLLGGDPLYEAEPVDEGIVPTGQDRPTIDEALDAVAELLEGSLSTELDARTGFMMRVGARLLRLLQREVIYGSTYGNLDRLELAQLLKIDAADGIPPLQELLVAVSQSLRKRLLCAGEVLGVLSAITARKLAIANPSYRIEAGPPSPPS